MPTGFDKATERMLANVIAPTDVLPMFQTEQPWIDARILKTSKGYLVPLAIYAAKVGQLATIAFRLPSPVTKSRSAYHGDLPVIQAKGRYVVTIPSLGYGDILRFE